MRIFNGLIAMAICIMLVFTWPTIAQVENSILPIEQVKKGMEGKGRSVFLGEKLEEFDVEILGVLRNFQPKKNMILAKLIGSNFEKAGVAQGMSGSPVYIEGKLVGAIAYSFPFAKEAIAGITPIGEMLAIEKRTSPRSSFSSRMPIQKYLTLEELYEANKGYLTSVSSSPILGEQACVPLGVPLVFSGFSSEAFNRSKPYFTKIGFTPIMAGTSGQTQDKLNIPDLKLRGGDTVGAQLVTGDLDISAIGTVTYVEGSKVLAFGHPWYNLGSVDYAMTKAEVITILPSVNTSFKITSTGAMVGRFTQDRTSGLLGEIGKAPQLIPVNIKMLSSRQEIKDIKVKVAEDKILTPFLVNAVVSSLLLAEERQTGDLSLGLSGDIHLENGGSIHLEDLFSGNFDTSITSLSNLLTSVTYFLTNNEFRNLGIYQIDLEIYTSEDIKISFLEKVWLDKYDVSPGEVIQVKIYTRDFRGEGQFFEGSIPAPHLPSGSQFYLVVADTMSLQQIERVQYRSQAFMPRSLEQLIRILNNQRKNNRIYFKIMAEKPGLFLKGEEMPNLPPTMKSMFSSPRAATSTPTELNQSTLSHYQRPVPYVFRGAAVIPVKIK